MIAAVEYRYIIVEEMQPRRRNAFLCWPDIPWLPCCVLLLKRWRYLLRKVPVLRQAKFIVQDAKSDERSART